MFELISHHQVGTEDRMLAPQMKNDQFLKVNCDWLLGRGHLRGQGLLFFLPVTKIRCTITKEIHSRMAHWMGYRFSW